ncbi:hypothetical protein [Rhodopila globiformis]|uniref:Uncharacterized protein n=1 Tax=Rhodopila globiformis TaxID=1071 RepID=A0A2S6NF36_RHOGL|nr:hypothetical protein [Rhodopila globiformis]PPQ33189.1 hypothetical protein CCS01_14830 [Rhodopila globiformis]
MISGATIAAVLLPAGAAQTPSPHQWVTNCVAAAESPEATAAWTDEGQQAPSHAKILQSCVDSWNSLHPLRKIKPKDVR